MLSATRTLQEITEAAPDQHSLPFSTPFAICLLVVCGIFSALCSGLTLGLLSIDVMHLKLAAQRQPNMTPAEEKLAALASRVLKVRKDGNFLLVTLLICNVAVNSGFSIILEQVTDFLTSFLVSTFVITLFGEIIPQAVCSRYAIQIGGRLYFIVYILEIALWVLVKPISICLNYILGEDLGSIQNKKQLRALVDFHDYGTHVISKDEARILKGGLDFSNLTAEAVMTPLQNVFGIDINTTLNFSVATKLVNSGVSRVPIFDFSKEQCIVGLIFMKDLVFVDPAFEIPIRSIRALFGRRIYAVDHDASLLNLLADFKKGHTHLAVVRRVITPEDADPYYKHIGIVTLEDILEEILQDEIQDEFDNPNVDPVKPLTLLSSLAGDLSEEKLLDTTKLSGGKRNRNSLFLSGRMQLFDKKRPSEPLDKNESLTIGMYLCRVQENLFTNPLINQGILQMSLEGQPVVFLPVGKVLYHQKMYTGTALLILQGNIRIISDDQLPHTILGPWTFLGSNVLTLPERLFNLLRKIYSRGVAKEMKRNSAYLLDDPVTIQEMSVRLSFADASKSARFNNCANWTDRHTGRAHFLQSLASSNLVNSNGFGGGDSPQASYNEGAYLDQSTPRSPKDDVNTTLETSLKSLSDSSLQNYMEKPAETVANDNPERRRSLSPEDAALLQEVEDSVREWANRLDFKPTFLAVANSPLKVLFISKKLYGSVITATALSRLDNMG